eukprot:2316246-Rhodomonas_salina.1
MPHRVCSSIPTILSSDTPESVLAYPRAGLPYPQSVPAGEYRAQRQYCTRCATAVRDDPENASTRSETFGGGLKYLGTLAELGPERSAISASMPPCRCTCARDRRSSRSELRSGHVMVTLWTRARGLSHAG